MNSKTALYKNAWPYQQDKMSLPVRDLATALPFYKEVLKFGVTERKNDRVKTAILTRNEVQIGLAENGGDPEQDGCFFEVDSVEQALLELQEAGLTKELSALKMQKQGNANWKVFFLVAPDGLCFCIGEKLPG